MSKKVSIITPCLNGEKFIGRYFESILNQIYTNIELIFINDGSTDNTEKIIKSYLPKLKEKNIEFIYIYKENEGQASEINDGLKLFTGDYLIWPDSDDILDKYSICKRVDFLEKNKEYGIVRSKGAIVNENNINDIKRYFAMNQKSKTEEYIFENLIRERNIWIACGCYMIRTEAFLDVNPNREIYKYTRGGQNWQMLLPITYKYKCGYIDESLYTYVVRKSSHSHKTKDIYGLLEECDSHEDILINTINRINMSKDEKERYTKIIKEKYIEKRIRLKKWILRI